MERNPITKFLLFGLAILGAVHLAGAVLPSASAQGPGGASFDPYMPPMAGGWNNLDSDTVALSGSGFDVLLTVPAGKALVLRHLWYASGHPTTSTDVDFYVLRAGAQFAVPIRRYVQSEWRTSGFVLHEGDSLQAEGPTNGYAGWSGFWLQ